MLNQNSSTAVDIHDLCAAFKNHIVLDQLNLQVKKGEFVALVGPTGCGKSTLLNVVSGLLAPSSGSVTVMGQVYRGLNPYVGYIFQQDSLSPWKTALDNIALPMVFHGKTLTESRHLTRTWLENYFFGDRDGYLKAISQSGEIFSKDGIFSLTASENVLKILSQFDEKVSQTKIDLNQTYTNAFVKQSLAKHVL